MIPASCQGEGSLADRTQRMPFVVHRTGSGNTANIITERQKSLAELANELRLVEIDIATLEATSMMLRSRP